MKRTIVTSSIKRTAYTASLLAFGYFIGASGSLMPQSSNAQPPGALGEEGAQAEITLSNESVAQIQRIHESLSQLMETMSLAGTYTPATEGVNPYLILTGGGSAIDDLEQGTGVDPITFADLYAGKATQEIEDSLSWDQSKRLMYKNKLVRVYSVEKLKNRRIMQHKLLTKRVNIQ